jgi:phosphonate transport system substrate-binding protein
LPYVQLARQQPAPVEPVAAPVLEGERYQGRPIYFSDVVVHRDSPYHRFVDLRGASWAYNDPDSHSGCNITRFTLMQMGETQGFFGRVVESGYHQSSIRLVAAREIDASAIDSQVLAVELRDHPELATQLRVIDSLGPSTIQPVVVSVALPAELKTGIRDVLLSLHTDTSVRDLLARGFVERFVGIDDAAYDDIRAMEAAVEKIGFPHF